MSQHYTHIYLLIRVKCSLTKPQETLHKINIPLLLIILENREVASQVLFSVDIKP